MKMEKEVIISSRPDRELRKKIITPGDYMVVPYEDARCKIVLSNVVCTNGTESCEIESESLIFSKKFNGNVLIGDNDCFLDKDFELILQQMCCGETCEASMVYRDFKGALVKQISCQIDLKEVMEEQLISDWSWERLHEASLHHKEQGVQLVKEKKLTDAFRRFNKALKMLIAIEPIDPAVIGDERVKEMLDLKVKLYNNLCLCQLHYHEYNAAIQLSNDALKLDPKNAKALYRRCTAHAGLEMYEEAWRDIQEALKIEPNDKAMLQKASTLKPIVEDLNKKYTNVIKKMFG